jgi:hypothetical protein
VMSACRMEATLVSLHVVFPVVPLVNVCGAELPVLFRLIDALKESLSLLIVRKVQEYLDDLRTVAMKVFLQINDRAIPLYPNVLVVAQLLGEPLAAEKFRVHSNDEHLLVVGTVEDADPSAFGKAASGAPEKIMFKLLGAWVLEAEDLATFRTDPGYDMAYGSVFSGSIDALEYP